MLVPNPSAIVLEHFRTLRSGAVPSAGPPLLQRSFYQEPAVVTKPEFLVNRVAAALGDVAWVIRRRSKLSRPAKMVVKFRMPKASKGVEGKEGPSIAEGWKTQTNSIPRCTIGAGGRRTARDHQTALRRAEAGDRCRRRSQGWRDRNCCECGRACALHVSNHPSPCERNGQRAAITK